MNTNSTYYQIEVILDRYAKYILLPLFVFGLMISASAQMDFPCGEDRMISVDVQGLLDGDNCISISNTSNMLGATVEVWIEESDCSGSVPSSIRFEAGGQTVTATGAMAEQHSGSTVAEYIYRAHITGSFNEVCISGLSGCRASSGAVYTERQVADASASQVIYDLEFNRNGCQPIVVNVGSGSANRNFDIKVPIHEKGDPDRTVRIEAEALRGGNVVRTATQTFDGQNAGNEASLYNLDLNNVPGGADQIRVKVCSPTADGDSFGVGSVIVSSPNCQPSNPQVCETCNTTSSCTFDRAFFGFGDVNSSGQCDWSLGSTNFESQGSSQAEICSDGALRFTSTIVNRNNPCEVWEVCMYLTGGYDWATWSGMGRTFYSESDPHGLHETWNYYYIDDSRSFWNGVGSCNSGQQAQMSRRPTGANPTIGVQVGYGAGENSTPDEFNYRAWFGLSGAINTDCGDFTITGGSCEPVCDNEITGLKIYDQATDAPVENIPMLSNGVVINEIDLPANYYIVAELADEHASVRLTVDGTEICENFIPFTFPGGAQEGSNWNGGLGTHTVHAQLFSVEHCGGKICDERSISFSIVSCDISDIACPPDVTISCDQDINDLSITGMASFDCDADISINFTDEVIRETCPQQVRRTFTTTVMQTNTNPCVPMTLARFNFAGPSSGSLCGDFGGNPLAGSGVPASSVHPGQCSSGFRVSNVRKDGQSSCVQGAFGGSKAGACVGGQDSNRFSGSDSDVTSFEVNFGASDQGIFSQFCFFERAVTTNENFGRNFPPSLYGIQVVRDGAVIFEQDDIPTTGDWTQECFDFGSNPAFEYSGRTNFEIRLLGYAPSEDRADDDQNIWEIDEFKVFGCCGTTTSNTTEEFTCTQVITVDDNEVPTLSNVPGDITVTCIDDVPEVSMDVVADDNCAFTTSFSEVQDPEGESCNLTITRTWTVTDDCDNEVSDSQVITVATDIMAEIIADDTNVCEGETVTLEALGSKGCGENAGDYTYAWTGPEGFASSERVIEVSDLGTYNVVITDSAGCEDSAEVTLDDELCMSIGSTVFVDNNNNGIQDGDDGDVGIEGVTVELWMGGDLVGTTTTDADGNYFFGSLEPGDYIVEILAEGNMGPGEPLENFHRSSDPTDTADNQQDGDDNGIQEGGITTDVSSPVITLSPGDEPTGGAESSQGGDQDDSKDENGDMTVDFGFVPELSIGSTVFVDNNNNGIQDAADGDEGIAGVTLELWQDDELVGTTTTDADGNYFFGWLAPGDYIVEILAEDNMEAGQPLELFHRSSDPTDTADNQEDGDDNGMQPDGLGTDVSSPVITLSAGDEPTGTMVI